MPNWVVTVTWVEPTGVDASTRKELEAVPQGPEREALFEQLVARQYAAGQAMNMAATLEIDAVIDPADTRGWLLRGLAASRVAGGTAQPLIDTW